MFLIFKNTCRTICVSLYSRLDSTRETPQWRGGRWARASFHPRSFIKNNLITSVKSLRLVERRAQKQGRGQSSYVRIVEWTTVDSESLFTDRRKEKSLDRVVQFHRGSILIAEPRVYRIRSNRVENSKKRERFSTRFRCVAFYASRAIRIET